MFLKNLLRKLLYKSECEFCSRELDLCKIFCEQCQTDFYYSFSQNKDLISKSEKGYFLLLEKEPYFKLLIQKAQNPRNTFLIEGVASLVIVLIHALNLPWPEKLVKTKFLENRGLNNLFFKKLSFFLGLPISEKKKLKGLFFYK